MFGLFAWNINIYIYNINESDHLYYMHNLIIFINLNLNIYNSLAKKYQTNCIFCEC